MWIFSKEKGEKESKGGVAGKGAASYKSRRVAE
jgi:hypothetical protein